MSAHAPAPGERPAGGLEPRAIPDGGLGEAMPEWLRRPPAWRHLEPRAPARAPLPPPDTSEIDPATLVSIEDFPAWLQAVARPAAVPAQEPPAPQATPERRVIPRVIEARPRPAPAPGEDAPADEPAATSPPFVPLHEARPTGPSPAIATVVLGTLLAVALVVIVVLLWLQYG